MDRDGVGDACDPFPEDTDNLGACLTDRDRLIAQISTRRMQNSELRTENDRLRVELEKCQSAGQDEDGDGVADTEDQCPESPPGGKVDARGCTLAQFCGAIDVSPFSGLLECFKADWMADEKHQFPGDCQIVTRGFKLRCVAGGH